MLSVQVQVQRPHIQELQISQVSCASDTWTVASLSTNTLKGHASLHLVVCLCVGLSTCCSVSLSLGVSAGQCVCCSVFLLLLLCLVICLTFSGSASVSTRKEKENGALASISGMLCTNVQCCFIMCCPVNNSPAGGPGKQDKGGPHRELAV